MQFQMTQIDSKRVRKTNSRRVIQEESKGLGGTF